ncbi:hypothetical protein O3G_MSEX013329 [Manduca sexta]|uniref:THAP-type domain-containing protein n=1 Tax=Manduca sexta TaxID=7130 RepID=A0A922CZ43_MANSE|nr:hypothetical protein O3G_MSEX013329 [Manduca sexta]
MNIFFRIPSDPIMRSRWTQIIRRSRCEELWKPSKYSLVCSDHFNKNEMYFVNNEGRRRLKKTAVPCKVRFLFFNLALIILLHKYFFGDYIQNVIFQALFLSSVQSDGSDIVTDEEINNSSIAFDAGSGISRDKPHINFVDMRNTSNAPENTGHWQHTKNTSNDTEIETEVYEEFSDLDSVFDTPKEAKLRRDLHRKNILQRKHILKIQSLRRKIIRLKKKITTYKEIIGNLKKEK